MLCELRAAADAEGRLHLLLGADGAEWLHYVLRGPVLILRTAAGERRLSSRTALKLLLRELWLRESSGPSGSARSDKADPLRGACG